MNDYLNQFGRKMKLALVLLVISTVGVFAQVTVTGVVKDATGEVVIGGAVLVQGTTIGTVTDYDGNYSVNAPSADAKLVFSYVGYQTQTIAVNGKSVINVTLSEDAELLDEVIVVGYGTQKKSDLTGSVVSVRADDLNAIPSSSLGEMLRGQASGVQVTIDSSRPGGSSGIVIRGNKSISGGNSPLYVVDGVPVDNIDDFNAQDILSLEVLKDAASTSIYGARASNGVILVTTKKGQAGKTAVDFNAYYGMQFIQRNFDFYSPTEFATLKMVANGYDPATITDDEKASLFGSQYNNLVNENYTDWEDLMISPAVQQKYDLSVRGGSEKSKFALSLGHFDQQGMVAPAAYNRTNFRLNVEQELYKNLKVGVNSTYIYSEKYREDSSFSDCITQSPLLSAYDEDGNLNALTEDGKYSPLWNNEHATDEEFTNRSMTNVYLDWTIMKGLTYRLNTSYNFRSSERGIYYDSEHDDGVGSGGMATITIDRDYDYLVENILTYSKVINEDHNFDVTLVQSVNSELESETILSGSGFSVDDLSYNAISMATTTEPTLRTLTPRNLMSYMGRVRYNMMEKYLFSLSIRADGSSVFGANNKWGYFPSASLGWRIIEEDFMKDLDIFSNLKLRGSFGQVGNQAIDPYESSGFADSYYFSFGDQSAVVGYTQSSQLYNPDLKWETTTSGNIGLDFGLYKERISGVVEYYHSTTKDLLMEATLDQSTGYSTQMVNMGSVLNSGIEASLNFIPVQTRDLTWTVGVSVSTNHNEILSLPGGVDDTANEWFIGKSINCYYNYEFGGIYQTEEDLPDPDVMVSYTPSVGDIIVVDQNGDGDITAEDKIVYERDADWIGSLSTTVKYKGIDLSVDFYTSQGGIKQNSFLWDSGSGGDLKGVNNGMKVDYWTSTNPSNTAPEPNTSTVAYLACLSYQDASYIRLKNVTLGYTVPKSITKKARIDNLRFYVTGTNLWTITDFLSYSPESSASSYPEATTILGGVNLSF